MPSVRLTRRLRLTMLRLTEELSRLTVELAQKLRETAPPWMSEEGWRALERIEARHGIVVPETPTTPTNEGTWRGNEPK